MKMKSLILVVPISLLITGCSLLAPKEKPIKSADIIGEWKDNCMADSTTGTSLQIVRKITDQEVIVEHKKFADKSCDSSKLINQQSVNYVYTLGKNIKTADGKIAREINYNSTGFSVQKGGMIQPPQDHVYGIVWVENEKLYLGAKEESFKNTTPQSRPKKLAPKPLVKVASK
jgi:hypothetical protein